MKVVGRKILADSDVAPLAKRRLALWVKQMKDARFSSLAHLKVAFPNIRELGNNRVSFPFADSGIEVETFACFDHEIMCIDKIVEQDVAEK